MKKGKIYFCIYFILGLLLLSLAVILIYYIPIKVKLTSELENTLLITDYLLTISVPGKYLILGGDLIGKGILDVSSLFGNTSITIDNINFATFNMNYITIGLLLGAILLFIVGLFLFKKVIPGYILGSLEIGIGIATLFEIYFFLYFNQNGFNDAGSYLEGTEINVSYLTLGSYLAGSILIILGILIIVNSIIQKNNRKKLNNNN